MTAIKVVSIGNSVNQLSALPIGESIFILFDKEPHLQDCKDNITLSRLNDESTWPNVGDPNAHQIAFVKEKYETVAVDLIITSVGSQWQVELAPKEPLYTNAKYFLFINAGIRESFYTLTKPITFSASSVEVTANRNVALTDTSTYDIYITATSSLSSGKLTVRYTLHKDSVVVATNVSINILNTNIQLNDKTSVKLNPNQPFINNEKFTVVLNAAELSTDKKYQEVTTLNDADVTKTEDNPSGRIQYEDIVNFYASYGFGKNPTPTPVQAADVKTTIKYIDNSRVLLTFDKEIKIDSIVPNSFRLTLSEAYGNYLLDQLELYNPNTKYICTFAVADTKNIILTFAEDTANLVPIDRRYIVQG